MKQVSSPPELWRALAPAILRARGAAYGLGSVLLLGGWLANGQRVWGAITAAVVAAILPYTRRSGGRWQRIELAVAADLVVAALAWWRLPGDPVLPLVMTLWAVAVGAFFCAPRMAKALISMIVAVELVKLPLGATVFANRFGAESFFRELFESEWLIHLALATGRLMIILATYSLFRAISRLYRTSQEKVEENEIRFRRLVETSPNAILVVQDGSIVFLNPTAPGVLGADCRSLMGRPVLDVIPANHHETVRAMLDDAEAKQRIARLENIPLLRIDGATGWVDLTFAPTIYEAGRAVQIVVQDVTERFEAAQILAESEERYRQFFEKLPVALYRTSPDGKIIDANQETVRLLGVSDESELVNHMASSFYVDAQDREAFGRDIRRLGAVMGQEVPMIRATGERIWVRDSARVVDTRDGDIYEGALIDITDRKRVESELHTRARQQETIARIGQLALAGTDLEELYQTAVRAIRAELRSDLSGIVRMLEDGSFMLEAGDGLPFDAAEKRVFGREDGSGIRAILAAPEAIVIDDLRAETRFTPTEMLLSLGATTGAFAQIRTPDGAIGIAGAFRTDGMVFSHDDAHFLESLANVLGAAIHRRQAAERLEELVRSKDQFVAAVSHEVRTPLTVVAGLAEELHDRWRAFTPAEVEELLAMLVDQSREMSDLIEDLLVSARADIGKVRIRPEPVRLDEHVSAVLEPLPPDHAARIAVSSSPATAMADPVRLRQIIRNLVTNAIRYGGPNITISVGNGDPTAYLEVRDNGEPIAGEDREKIFEPYHRAHEFAGRTASVGLGLAVSRTLAELMRGTLTYSHNGESVFRLTLPSR